ncbi:MAG: hypothetical protein GQ523_08315 [Methanophagales archaeon]|nr:hypothetical protein [Methanophagales archaeon]
MYKRYIYQKKHKKDLQEEEIYFIHKDEPLDRAQQAFTFSFETIEALGNIEYWTNIWLLSISLSVIKTLKISYERKGDKEKEQELNKVIGSLPDEILEMVNDPQLVTPFGYLTNILDRSHSSIIKIARKQYRLTSILNRVRSGVAIFIDNVDEYFGGHLGQHGERSSVTGVLSSELWYNAQIGLINAIWVLSGQSSHIKVFASIRKEAWERLLRNDPIGLQKKGSALDIGYTKSELKDIFEKNIKRMNKKDLVNANFINEDLIYAFLGLSDNKIANARVDNQKEDIFDYIYRHTLKRPRDFMVIGGALAAIYPNERTEVNIRSVVNREATTIARTYLAETKPFLDFIRPFDELFDLIDSDILSKSEIKGICSTYNNQKNCEKNHVFCNLYKVGLLGYVDIDEENGNIIQKFERPGDKIFESKILPVSDFYLIHPILNSLIRERKKMKEGAPYHINPRTIVGDGRPWKNPRIYRTDRYCSFIYRVCSTDRFLNKRGVFLASSASKKEFVEVLGNKLKKLNLAVEPDKWTTPEKLETGRVLCDEVCPKVFRNLWMLAEVSDFNPNVFFECGFALGLGRRVVFLCDDKSEDIKAKLGEQLYKSYQTVDEIPDKLGWKTEKFNNNKINDLYQVPRVFKHINNFNSPNDRDKSNEVYVVSFNHETELVRKLTERYSYTKVAINILDQCFIPEGLAESLINARAVLVNLAGVQRGSNDNKMHDAQLMFLAGICVSQGVPVKIFQSHKNFYRDVWNISIMDNSGEDIVKFADACPYKNTE